MVMQALLLKYFLSADWVCDIIRRPRGGCPRVKQGDKLSASWKLNPRGDTETGMQGRENKNGVNKDPIENVNTLSKEGEDASPRAGIRGA